MPSEPNATAWSPDACYRGKSAVERTSRRSGSLNRFDRNQFAVFAVRLHGRHRVGPARGPARETRRKRISPKQGGNGDMKNKAGLIVPVVMILLGAYALLTALGSSGEQVNLIADHALPRGLAIVFGLIGVGGGAVVLLSALSKRQLTSS